MEKSIYNFKETKVLIENYLKSVRNKANEACKDFEGKWDYNYVEDYAEAFFCFHNYDDSLKYTAAILKYEDCDSEDYKDVKFLVIENGQQTRLDLNHWCSEINSLDYTKHAGREMTGAKKFTVWVGGVEANDEYLSYDEAHELIKEYKEAGYDDTQIDMICLC